MSGRRPAPTAALRGGAVGATVAALAIAAHGVGGGVLPDLAGLTLLIAACVAVGIATAGTPTLTRSRWTLLAALAAGQGLGHLALALTADPHLHRAVPATAMLAAHALATTGAAALIGTAERLYEPITRVLRSVLTPPVLAASPARPVRPRPLPHRAPRLTVLATGLSRRGPPARVRIPTLRYPTQKDIRTR